MALQSARYYSRIAIHVLTALFKLGFLLPFWSAERRAREVRAWSTRALAIFGFSVSVRGIEQRCAEPVLLVSNHLSWLDVLLIQTQFDAVFVAKGEVRSWPAFGWIAQRLGTVFVSRRQTLDLVAHNQALARQLLSGSTVCIFPEGTTTDGRHVLRFKTAIFQAAVEAGVAVQPIFIRYWRRDGSHASEAAFIGDMSLLQSFKALARLKGATAELHVLPHLMAGASRRDLAVATQGVIASACQRANMGGGGTIEIGGEQAA